MLGSELASAVPSLTVLYPLVFSTQHNKCSFSNGHTTGASPSSRADKRSGRKGVHAALSDVETKGLVDRTVELTEAHSSVGHVITTQRPTPVGLPELEDINKILMPPPSVIPKKIKTSQTVSDGS